jgi:DNA-binding response OmpR family regulator
LLLTDVLMPGINGQDLAARMTHIRPGLKVLFMSASTDGFAGEEGMALLRKPFSPMGLVFKVRAALDGS